MELLFPLAIFENPLSHLLYLFAFDIIKKFLQRILVVLI